MDSTTLMGAILASELQQGRRATLSEDVYYSKHAGATIWDRANSMIGGMRRRLQGLAAAHNGFVAAYNKRSRLHARSI